MKIRAATRKDTDSICGLVTQLGRPAPKSKQEKKKFEKLIQQYISNNDKQIIIAEDNSKVVGLASIVFLTRLNQSKKEMWIPELIVSKDYQNKGIGKKLILACSIMAKKEDCFRIRLESGNKRKGTHKFYKRIGFEQYALSFRKHIK